MKIRRFNADKDRGIRIFPISRHSLIPLTTTPVPVARRAHNRAPRAHAEGIHPPAMRRMAGKLIIRRTERRVACKPPILRTVDQLLWMLNARADRKGFCII